MKKFCIITNKSKDECFEVTKRIETLISEYGGTSVSFGDPLNVEFNSSPENIKTFGPQHEEALNSCECVIVLGGDGTILETSRAIGEREIPMVGINLGTLGFMSCIERSQIDYAIKELVEDNFTIENRMQLSGDGCLVSTPTGSTGYNLSAGGPIVTPEAKLMCITPICPHTFNSRTIVVSGDDKVRIVVGEKKKLQDTESFATIDGQMAVRLNAGDYIDVEQAETVAKFIRLPGQSYFNVLNLKLNG